MTKTEYGKCEKLMEDAIQKVVDSKKEYSRYEFFLQKGDTIQAEVEQRKADQHYGYAEGINQVLAIIGFKHDKMKELSKLL